MSAFNKIIILLVGIVLPLSFAFAQDSVVTISYDKKREKITSLLIYKYESGEYDELIDLSLKYTKKWDKKNVTKPSENVQQLLLRAKANYAILKFSEADRLAAEAE